jgi:thiamine biosynthesis lipoprotein
MKSVIGAAFAGAVLGAPAEASVVSLQAEDVLGTSLKLAARGAQPDSLAAAEVAAFAEIARLDAVLSAWRGDSELAALNAATRFSASPDLFAVIAAAERWRAATGGFYSGRLGLLREAWRDASTQPDSANALAFARQLQGASVRLYSETRTIEKPDIVRFDLDGAAKGYVIDRAFEAARRAAPDAEGLLLEIGGDLRVWSAIAPWRIGIADPSQVADNTPPAQTLLLSDGAIAMSGRGPRDIVAGDGAASHVLDPWTGRPAATFRAAAVHAPTAMDADALSTALMASPVIDIGDFGDMAGWAMRGDGAAFRTSSWSAEPYQNAACHSPIPAVWPAGFRVEIALQIPEQAVANYRRPYVAVWISDSERRLVRTLLVVGPEARWRESNYVFWRRFERMAPEAVHAMARPTRAPGRYDVIWDGRSDSGQPAPLGRYTLTIEASREHGEHSIQTILLDIGATPFDANAEASQELGPTRVRYGRAQ